MQARSTLSNNDEGPVRALRQWTNRLTTRRDLLEAKVLSLLQHVARNTPVPGTCTFDPARFRSQRPEVRQLLLSRVARMVSPATNRATISPVNVLQLDRAVFGYHMTGDSGQSKITPGAGVLFTSKRKRGKVCWVVSRQPLRPAEQAALTCSLPADQWTLWDGRFWLHPMSDGDVSIVKQEEAKVSPSSRWVMPVVQSPDAARIVQVGRTQACKCAQSAEQKSLFSALKPGLRSVDFQVVEPV